MKIAVISSGHIPSQWAHSINTMKTADSFYKLGHDVEILTVERYPENMQRKTIENIHDFYGISRGIKISFFRDNLFFYYSGIKPVRLMNRALAKITGSRIRYIRDPEKVMSEYCKASNVDVCYCRSYRAVYYNIKNKVPTVMESHTPKVGHPDLERVIDLSGSEHFLGIVTISEALKDNFVTKGVPAEKVLVLQDGVDVGDFMELPSKEKSRDILGLPRDKKIVVYCGSLFPDKGIEHILLVAKEVPDAVFLLVGGRERQIRAWKEYVSSQGINNVWFQGFVENRKVPFYLRAAEALIMPYKTDQEIKVMDISTTSPLKLFEYMAAQKPIISTDIPAISRTITNGVDGLLAEPNNVQELARFVKMVLNDEKLSEKLSKNAYKTVQKYDLKTRCTRILQR